MCAESFISEVKHNVCSEMTDMCLPTFIGALAHPPPAHGDSLSRRRLRVNRPIIPCGFCRHRVLHLRLDEELQDVGVLLVLGLLTATAVGCVSGGLWTQHQVAVVEATLHGFVHDVEPGPRLHDTPYVVLALVGLLQVLENTTRFTETWGWFHKAAEVRTVTETFSKHKI